jgi:hypothetical protein
VVAERARGLRLTYPWNVLPSSRNPCTRWRRPPAHPSPHGRPARRRRDPGARERAYLVAESGDVADLTAFLVKVTG